MIDKEQLDTVSDEIQWFVEYFNKNPTEMYKYDMADILCEYYQIQKSLSTKEKNNLDEFVLENIYVNPRLVYTPPHMDESGTMKDNNVSSFALFQSSEPDYADMKFNSHSDIEHILNESAFTFPSSVLSSIDLGNLNFPIFDDESYDKIGDDSSSKEFSFDDFDSQKVKSQNDASNIRVHSQNSLDSSSFTSDETESDIYFTAFDCLDLLEQFEAVESLEPSPVKSETKAPIGVAHLRGSVSILKKSIDRTLSDILVNIRLDHNYCKREDAGPPTKKRKLNIEEYKNRKGLPRSTYETTVESSSFIEDEKTAIQKYHQKVNELKMKVLIAQPKSKIGGSRSPILPAKVISPKIEPSSVPISKVEVSPNIIVIPKTEAPDIEASPLLIPKSEILPILTPKPEEVSPIIEPVVPLESKPSIVVKSIGVNTDLTNQNESHRMFLAKELAQISNMSAIVEKMGSKIKSTSLITVVVQNMGVKEKNLVFSQEDGGLIEVEDSAAVVKKLKSSSETVDAITQTDLTLSKNLLSTVLDDPISCPSSSKMETEDRVDMKRASCERRILYVGDLTKNCTKQKLQKRFEKFGKILQITLHFKRSGKYYGFIVYDDITGVSAAIDNGNKVPGGPIYYLNFGGRKEFLDDQTYFDFDSHPENRMSSSSRPRTYEEELMEYECLRDGRSS